MRRRTIPIIFVLLIAAAYALNSYFLVSYPKQQSFVTKVIDGDTLVVEGGRRIRLLSIDTRERGENCYQEATERLEQLVLLKNITLERDRENKDRYDRLLRHVYVDNMSAGLQLVTEGLAVVYIIEPNTKHAGEFREAEQIARNEGGCVWTKQP